MSAATFKGVIPILPTPFKADEEIDFEAIPAMLDFAVSCGVSSVGTPAYGSERYKLDGAERLHLLESVIEHSAGRLRVIAQCNHESTRLAARLAAEAERLGADAINVALPRAFPSSKRDLLNHARAVCDAVSIPVFVQDWSPSGDRVGLDFALDLQGSCSNFRYLKLEDPGIGPLIRSIRQETDGQIGVFLGWGGMYISELHASGAAGVMPGLSLADVFVRFWQLADEENWSAAHAIFVEIAPFIQYSLTTFEVFHHAEKHLLQARGVLPNTVVRHVTVELNDDAQNYIQSMISYMVDRLDLKGDQSD